MAVVRPLTLEPSTTEVLRVSSETRREAASPPAQSVRLQCTPDALPSWRPALVVDAWRALDHSLAMVQQEAEDAKYADGLRQRAVRLHRDDWFNAWTLSRITFDADKRCFVAQSVIWVRF